MQLTYSVIGVVIGGLFAYVLLSRKKPVENSEDKTAFTLLLQQMSELQKTVDQKLGDSEKSIAENMRFQSTQSNQIISDITERLTRLDEGNKQVLGFAESLNQLQDILKNPKQRGTILGEYYLETILSKVLPPKTFQTQYPFKNGEIVDAVVFVGKKIIPIDSKFSLENYNRIIEAHKGGSDPEPFVAEFKKDIKKRIDETSKYIRPDEDTLDFAFMFIPHESIYYDLLIAEVGTIKVNTQDLVQYAFEKKVIIVSPTSFLAYLQTVLQGLRSLQIEESAKDIVKRVGELGKHLKAYEEYHNKIGNSLNTVVNHYTSSGKELRKVDKDVMRISGESAGIDPLSIEGSIEQTTE
ncbi:MAG: DNA recombination protein RmuC [Candidatus Pacebacteria bacterium]|nr:DNA recombination protein RmuC [Candidatus Paceibacterota bacterium]